MAIFQLGGPFVATNEVYESTKTYQPYYDSGTGQVFYTAHGDPGPDIVGCTEEVRGYPNGTSFPSACDGTTKIQGFSLNVDPFATVEITENSPDCEYVPPGETCDLIVNSVSKTDETSTGSNDGTATINASSTHTPIEYSLDNSTWQSSNFFSGLPPGTYTAFLRDAFACTKEMYFSIIAYNVPIQNFTTDLPVITQGGNTSRWSAAYNPIYIIYQRKDFNIASVLYQNTNQIKVTLTLQLAPDQITQAVNGKSYIKSGVYDFYDTAASHTIVGGVSVLIFNRTYLADSSGGFINIGLYKPGYQIETELTFGANAYDRSVIVAAHSSDYSGRTQADISGFLRTQLSTKDNYNYTDVSYKDANLGQSYTVRFREVWNTSQSEWFNGIYPLYFTYAAMQLGERYGGNMLEYVTFLTVLKAKFLTNWQSPMMWGGLPFEMSFIYSENIINQSLFLELTPDCGDQTNSFLLNADAGYLTDVDGGRFIIGSQYIEDITAIPVIQALGVTRVLIPDIFDCCARNILARLYYDNTTSFSTFHMNVSESASPYVDGNCQPKDNGVEIPGMTLFTTGSVTFNISAGHTYQFEDFVIIASPAANPRTRMTIIKDGVTIYDAATQAIVGASMVKSGIAQPGSVYTINVVASDNAASVTPIDIADDAPVVGGKVYVTEDKYISYQCKCDNDPYVYIKWLNSRGAWDYYKFGYNQFVNASISNDDSVSRYVQNWETSDTIEDIISKSSIQQLKVGANNLTEDAAKTLQWARKSIKVMMLVSANPVKWRTVIIKDGDTDIIQTRKPNSSSVAFTLLLPSDNIQTQ